MSGAYTYCGYNGWLYKEGKKFTLMGPRFGCFDTIGCGVTMYGAVFWTYNGMLCYIN